MCESLIHRTYDIFDTRNGFPGSGRGSGQTKVFKMHTGSPLLSLSPPPPPAPPPPPPHTVTCSLFHLPAMSVGLERASFHSTQHQVTKRRESLRTSWVQ